MSVYTPPDTVMGRALAARACALVEDYTPSTPDRAADVLDLVHAKDAELPQSVRDAAKDALDRGETHYTTRPGIVELRTAIATRSSAHGFPASADDVVITNGGMEALFVALQTLITLPTTVHIAGMAPRTVQQMIRFFGAEPVEIPASVDRRFMPSPEQIAESDPSILVVQSPSPLTGAAYSSDEIEAILEHAKANGHVVVLDQSVASGLDHVSDTPASGMDADLKLITIGSFSVEYGMGGWRIGWFTASKPFIKGMSGFKQTMSICTTAVSQYAALAALENGDAWVGERRQHYAGVIRDISAILAEAGLSTVTPDAFPHLLVDVTSVTSDDRAFRDALLQDAQVQVEAGSALHQSLGGFIRINVAATDSVDGVRRIAEYVNRRRSQ